MLLEVETKALAGDALGGILKVAEQILQEVRLLAAQIGCRLLVLGEHCRHCLGVKLQVVIGGIEQVEEVVGLVNAALEAIRFEQARSSVTDP